MTVGVVAIRMASLSGERVVYSVLMVVNGLHITLVIVMVVECAMSRVIGREMAIMMTFTIDALVTVAIWQSMVNSMLMIVYWLNIALIIVLVIERAVSRVIR